MADTPMGDGWWEAFDGKWYPPEQHPDFRDEPAPEPPAPSPPQPTVPPPPTGPSLQDQYRRPQPANTSKGFPFLKVLGICVAGFIGLAIIGAALNTSDDDQRRPSQTQQTNPAPTEPIKTEAERAYEALPFAHQQAADRGASYIASSGFSRERLIEQLEFEGFTPGEALAGVSFLEEWDIVDWRAEAVERAESYLDSRAWSRSDLIDQLEFEGFTDAEALHGVAQTYGS